MATEQRLGEYFWMSTVAALAIDLPTPRLEFYCDGVRAFMLQAEEGEDGLLFVLTDYDDWTAFLNRDKDTEPQSKRGLDLILDDETAAVGNEVFATEKPGTRAGVDAAIDLVVQWVTAEPARWQGVDAAITKATMSYDTCTHEIDRRYDNVQVNRADTPHRLSRKSAAMEQFETVGHAALTVLRTIAYYFEDRSKKRSPVNSCIGATDRHL